MYTHYIASLDSKKFQVPNPVLSFSESFDWTVRRLGDLQRIGFPLSVDVFLSGSLEMNGDSKEILDPKWHSIFLLIQN